jgi:hypothetical protein
MASNMALSLSNGFKNEAAGEDSKIERGPAFEGLATQVLRAHWTSRPHCTRYLAGLPARPTPETSR